MRAAVIGDAHARDEFHLHVGPAIAGNTAVEQSRDAGMLQPGQDAPLRLEPVEMRHRDCGHAMHPELACPECGEWLGARDVEAATRRGSRLGASAPD